MRGEKTMQQYCQRTAKPRAKTKAASVPQNGGFLKYSGWVLLIYLLIFILAHSKKDDGANKDTYFRREENR